MLNVFTFADGQFKHIAVNTDAKKVQGIYKLFYVNNALYAGSQESLAAWDLDVKAQIFKFKGQTKLMSGLGPVISFDMLSGVLFAAQAAGNIVGLNTQEGYAHAGYLNERKDVKLFWWWALSQPLKIASDSHKDNQRREQH